MKTKLIIILSVISFVLNAQVYSDKEAASRIRGASYLSINSKTNTPDNIKLASEVSIGNASGWLSEALNLTGSQKLVLVKEEVDDLGFICQRYQSYYNNMPIEGDVYIVHGKDGFIK